MSKRQLPQPRRERRTQDVEVHEDVGPRLRERRVERQISLRQFARRLGLSPSAVSQIETGKSRPSVSTLYAIVTELGMSIDELFVGEGAAAPEEPVRSKARTRSRSTPRLGDDRHVQRAGSRQSIELESGVRWERLMPRDDPNADFLYVVYDVGGSSNQNDRFIRHSGVEYGLVLSGTLEITVGFETYELGPGDSIAFDSSVPHRLRNVGRKPAHGVWFVLGRQDDPRFGGEPAG